MRKIILATVAVAASLTGAAQAADKWYTREQLENLNPRVREAGNYNVHPEASAGQSADLSAERGFGATPARSGKWYTREQLNSLNPRVREAGNYSIHPE